MGIYSYSGGTPVPDYLGRYMNTGKKEGLVLVLMALCQHCKEAEAGLCEG